MHIKPECDVESAEDFSRYYNNTFMESRDGRVLQVAGHHGSNIVLRDPNLPEEGHDDAYTMLPWKKVQTALIYGRPPSSLFKVGSRVYSITMGNNRQAGRGFKAEYYTFTRMQGRLQVRLGNIAGEHTVATAVYKPDVQPLARALVLAYDLGEDSILDSAYSVIMEGRVAYLVRRWENVGTFGKKGAILQLNELARFAEAHIRETFKYTGEILYAAVA